MFPSSRQYLGRSRMISMPSPRRLGLPPHILYFRPLLLSSSIGGNLTLRQIAMSSTTPLAGRLCKIFPPRLYVFISGVIMAIGLLVTSFAQNLAVFLVGRSIMGIGAGGCFTVAMLLVTHFGSVERRGLLLGILNSTFTIGVASGAAFSGALEAALGWVSYVLKGESGASSDLGFCSEPCFGFKYLSRF